MDDDWNCEKPEDAQSFCFGPPVPDLVIAIAERDRSRRVLLDSDLCVVDKDQFFIRGCLDLPIAETRGIFRWLVWVALSEQDFNRAVDLWDTPERESEPVYCGWLATSLPHYPETQNLECRVYTGPVGERPDVKLDPANHPLAVEQQTGISRGRAESLALHIFREWA